MHVSGRNIKIVTFGHKAMLTNLTGEKETKLAEKTDWKLSVKLSTVHQLPSSP